jgi:hypothetical protein
MTQSYYYNGVPIRHFEYEACQYRKQRCFLNPEHTNSGCTFLSHSLENLKKGFKVWSKMSCWVLWLMPVILGTPEAEAGTSLVGSHQGKGREMLSQKQYKNERSGGTAQV